MLLVLDPIDKLRRTSLESPVNSITSLKGLSVFCFDYLTFLLMSMNENREALPHMQANLATIRFS